MKTKLLDNEKSDSQDIFVSVVIVAQESASDLAVSIRKISGLLRSNYKNYEIIVVDNGISDVDVSAMKEFMARVSCLRMIRLSQVLTHDAALYAGLEVSIGDYVCTFDPIIDPLDEIPALIERNKYKDVIQGVSTTPIQSSRIGSVGRRLFYWYSRKYIGIDVPTNATYFASYSRRAVNSLTQSTRSQYHIRHLARRVGYSYETYAFKPQVGIERDRKLKTGLVEALEIAISYSIHPLRFVTLLGLIAGALNFFYAIYIVLVNVFNRHVAEGWTTTSMQLSLMFFMLFIAVVIISEYIGRILTESYKEPRYYVTDELTSSVALADTQRRNITG